MTLREPVHFIGIGGAGLSPLARLCLARGLAVTGCDATTSATVRRLRDLGAEIERGTGEKLSAQAGSVVHSSAVPPGHSGVVAARRNGVPVYDRRSWLPHFTADYEVIAVAGTHGKTTTTAALAWALRELRDTPSAVIGGHVEGFGGNTLVGDGRRLVIEADEYGHAFLGLHPELAVLTSVEHDHPDQYPTEEHVFEDFGRFLGNLKPGGRVVAGGDDAGVRTVLDRTRGVGADVTYGRDAHNALCIEGIRTNDRGGVEFEVTGADGSSVTVSSPLSGVYNALNLTAAIAVCEQLGHNRADAAAALESFEGVDRRFQVLVEVSRVALVEDYAHHPTAVRCAIDAARQRWPGRRVRVLFQPHTYSRVEAFLTGFQAALGEADEVLVDDIFQAREKEEETVTAQAIVKGLPNATHGNIDELQSAFVDQVEDDQVLILMGAGDITTIGDKVAQRLRDHFEEKENRERRFAADGVREERR